MKGDKIDNLLISTAVILAVALLTVVMVKPYQTETMLHTFPTDNTFVDDNQYKMSPPIQITDFNTTGYNCDVPDIWGDKIVYRNYNDTTTSIGVYCISNNTNYQLTPDNYLGTTTYPRIWNDYVTYFSTYYNISGVCEFLNISTGYRHNISKIPYYYLNYPIVFEDKVVYQDMTGVGWDVGYYNLTTNTYHDILSTPTYREVTNDFYGSRFVYSQNHNNIVSISYYDFNNNSYVNITNTSISPDCNSMLYPVIWGDNIVFQARILTHPGFLTDCYLYNISTDTITNLTSSLGGQEQTLIPYISENFVSYYYWGFGIWHYMVLDLNTNIKFEVFNHDYPIVPFTWGDHAIYTNQYGDAIMVFEIETMYFPHLHNLWIIYLNKTEGGSSYPYGFQTVTNIDWIYLASMLTTALITNIVLLANHRKEWWWT